MLPGGYVTRSRAQQIVDHALEGLRPALLDAAKQLMEQFGKLLDLSGGRLEVMEIKKTGARRVGEIRFAAALAEHAEVHVRDDALTLR